jgi:hypothetical protein
MMIINQKIKVMKNLFASKTNFRKNLQRVNAAYLRGNDFWFNPEDYGHSADQNLHVDFVLKGNRYFLVENIGYTNGGASWASLTITKYGSDEVVYYDKNHDGNGAWQTGDGSDARCEYSDLTNYILKTLRSYL